MPAATYPTHKPRSHMGIPRNSLQHQTLRLLDACESSIDDVVTALQLPGGMTQRRFLVDVLLPLQTMGLLHRCRDTHTWGTTDAGNTAARKLGPVAGAKADAPEDDGAAASTHAPGLRPAPCRPRLAMGTADHMPPAKRPGAMDALALPSRMGHRLHWPDGQVTPA